jgi:tetraacyldisaccharide 4'-kinase
LRDTVCRWADGAAPAGRSEQLLAGGLRVFSWLYAGGALLNALAYDTRLKPIRTLPVPVLCFGNLSTGGTGKTPLVMEAARLLLDAGFKPAVVSRGYRRVNTAAVVVVSDGRTIRATLETAGDEPLLMARQLPGVTVVVGADRYQAGRVACEQCGSNILLLDDGFQHRALARDCDLVLWDSLRPFEAGALLPRGLMREGFGALRRAHALILTRANLAPEPADLLARVRREAPHLEVFRTEIQIDTILPCRVNAERHEPFSISSVRDHPVAAFCGLGNPHSFWRLLAVNGLHLVDRRAFPDHYRPSASELNDLERMASSRGAQHLLMTEKDAENLPSGWTPSLPAWVVRPALSLGGDAERFRKFLLGFARKESR